MLVGAVKLEAASDAARGGTVSGYSIQPIVNIKCS